MITNDRQYKITKTQIQGFQKSIESMDRPDLVIENVHPALTEAYKNALISQLRELLSDVKEYEDLKAGAIVVTEVNSLKELPLTLIKARIANGLTQAELADALGLKEQQIQRYESERYDSASLKTLFRIADQLKINIRADVQIKEIDSVEIYNLKNYPFKQMFQRNWFSNFSGSLNEAAKNSEMLISNLFHEAGLTNIQYGLTKKSVRAGSSLNQFALNAWYARVIIQVKANRIETLFDSKTINESWLRNLAKLSRESNGPLLAVEYLQKSGIQFIIEPQLEGTFLDGAALLVDKNVPVIALTLRHDRLDNFWFVLFHEIAHIHLHLNAELDAIFDDLDDLKADGIEKEADTFALNALIPDNVWRKSLVRFSHSKEAIINQAEKLEVHPALIAGRIRRETGKYHLLTDLVGQGNVRELFIGSKN